jgi:hypothetical protein
MRTAGQYDIHYKTSCIVNLMSKRPEVAEAAHDLKAIPVAA